MGSKIKIKSHKIIHSCLLSYPECYRGWGGGGGGPSSPGDPALSDGLRAGGDADGGGGGGELGWSVYFAR